MKARVAVSTLADKLAKVEILTLRNMLAHTLVTTLVYKLVQVESKITGETVTRACRGEGIHTLQT